MLRLLLLGALVNAMLVHNGGALAASGQGAKHGCCETAEDVKALSGDALAFSAVGAARSGGGVARIASLAALGSTARRQQREPSSPEQRLASEADATGGRGGDVEASVAVATAVATDARGGSGSLVAVAFCLLALTSCCSYSMGEHEVVRGLSRDFPAEARVYRHGGAVAEGLGKSVNANDRCLGMRHFVFCVVFVAMEMLLFVRLPRILDHVFKLCCHLGILTGDHC